MANDKRHPMSTDMNDTTAADMKDPSTLTDKEREDMESGMTDSDETME